MKSYEEVNSLNKEPSWGFKTPAINKMGSISDQTPKPPSVNNFKNPVSVLPRQKRSAPNPPKKIDRHAAMTSEYPEFVLQYCFMSNVRFPKQTTLGKTVHVPISGLGCGVH